jgi:hypothetical protein
MKPFSRNFPLIPRIMLGAVLGALAFRLLLSAPELLFRVSLSNPRELPRILSLVFLDAFSTPWGAIGALIGGTLAWKGLRPPPEPRAGNQAATGLETSVWSKSWRLLPWRKLNAGEGMLAWGFVFLLVSFVVFPSVMVWMLAVDAPAGRRVIGNRSRPLQEHLSVPLGSLPAPALRLGLAVLGVAALFGTGLSYKLSINAYNLAHQSQRPLVPTPELWEWARFLGSCLISVLLIGPGMRFWTNWSPRRRLVWCVIILLFPIAALIMHRTLVAIGFLPLSA